MKKFLPVQGIKLPGAVIFGLIIFVLLSTTAPSFAHKVNIFAYVEGNKVFTESYFPDGRKVEGGTVEVYDSQENKLLSGTTDTEGKFNFVPPKKDNLKIVLIATMGHKNSYLLSAEELGGTAAGEESANESGQEAAQTENTSPESNVQAVSSGTGAAAVQVDVQEIKKIIDQSLDQKLAPIMRQLVKGEEEKVSPAQIFGGIGYIFGIIGIILYFTKKKAS
ncbi:MAG: hypothetical protein AB1847_17255 [bacterium]